MRRGEIGTDIRPRVIFIWEGAIATLPDYPVVHTLESFKRRMGLFDQAMNLWQIQDRTLGLMWSLLIRTDYIIDICVTARAPRFARAVARRSERDNWPVRYVFADTAQRLGRSLAHSPDIHRVYYGLEEHRFSFGPQGYFIGPDTPLTVS